MLGEFGPTAWDESFHTVCMNFARAVRPGGFNGFELLQNSDPKLTKKPRLRGERAGSVSLSTAPATGLG